ncbi:hypothetical protein M8J75_003084 [Diaphorina citri]|nr:hypothetical protein M8J75_003084 [Diaphorina citri]
MSRPFSLISLPYRLPSLDPAIAGRMVTVLVRERSRLSSNPEFCENQCQVNPGQRCYLSKTLQYHLTKKKKPLATQLALSHSRYQQTLPKSGLPIGAGMPSPHPL